MTTPDDEAESFVQSMTAERQLPFVPEVRLRLADEMTPLWEQTERRAHTAQPPPFWAFAWPGSLAFAHYLLSEPSVVRGKRVLDFAAGCGLAGIAAALAGAAHVRACDIDPLAAVAQRLNAALNQVSLEILADDLVGRELTDVDVVLAGDVCYERDSAESITSWLRALAAADKLVLLAEPGRAYAPRGGLELAARYAVPTTLELERTERTPTTIWRVLPVADSGGRIQEETTDLD